MSSDDQRKPIKGSSKFSPAITIEDINGNVYLFLNYFVIHRLSVLNQLNNMSSGVRTITYENFYPRTPIMLPESNLSMFPSPETLQNFTCVQIDPKISGLVKAQYIFNKHDNDLLEERRLGLDPQLPIHRRHLVLRPRQTPPSPDDGQDSAVADDRLFRLEPLSLEYQELLRQHLRQLDFLQHLELSTPTDYEEQLQSPTIRDWYSRMHIILLKAIKNYCNNICHNMYTPTSLSVQNGENEQVVVPHQCPHEPAIHEEGHTPQYYRGPSFPVEETLEGTAGGASDEATYTSVEVADNSRRMHLNPEFFEDRPLCNSNKLPLNHKSSADTAMKCQGEVPEDVRIGSTTVYPFESMSTTSRFAQSQLSNSGSSDNAYTEPSPSSSRYSTPDSLSSISLSTRQSLASVQDLSTPSSSTFNQPPRLSRSACSYRPPGRLDNTPSERRTVPECSQIPGISTRGAQSNYLDPSESSINAPSSYPNSEMPRYNSRIFFNMSSRVNENKPEAHCANRPASNFWPTRHVRQSEASSLLQPPNVFSQAPNNAHSPRTLPNQNFANPRFNARRFSKLPPRLKMKWSEVGCSKQPNAAPLFCPPNKKHCQQQLKYLPTTFSNIMLPNFNIPPTRQHFVSNSNDVRTTSSYTGVSYADRHNSQKRSNFDYSRSFNLFAPARSASYQQVSESKEMPADELPPPLGFSQVPEPSQNNNNNLPVSDNMAVAKPSSEFQLVENKICPADVRQEHHIGTVPKNDSVIPPSSPNANNNNNPSPAVMLINTISNQCPCCFVSPLFRADSPPQMTPAQTAAAQVPLQPARIPSSEVFKVPHQQHVQQSMQAYLSQQLQMHQDRNAPQNMREQWMQTQYIPAAQMSWQQTRNLSHEIYTGQARLQEPLQPMTALEQQFLRAAYGQTPWQVTQQMPKVTTYESMQGNLSKPVSVHQQFQSTLNPFLQPLQMRQPAQQNYASQQPQVPQVMNVPQHKQAPAQIYAPRPMPTPQHLQGLPDLFSVLRPMSAQDMQAPPRAQCVRTYASVVRNTPQQPSAFSEEGTKNGPTPNHRSKGR